MIREKKRYGNFVVAHDEKKGFVSVRSAVGNWQLRFRNDHAMYGALLKFSGDSSLDKYFDNLFTLWYVFTNGLPDGKCVEDLLKAAEEWYGRLQKADKVNPMKEDEAQVLKEVATAEEIQEEMQDGTGE